MEHVVVDPSSLGPLAKLDHGVELRDKSGRPFGWFFPAIGADQYVGYECPLSDAELDDIEKAGGGRELSEVLRDLEKLS